MPVSDTMKEVKAKPLDGVIQINTESVMDSDVGAEDPGAWGHGSVVKLPFKYFKLDPSIVKLSELPTEVSDQLRKMYHASDR